MLEVNATRYRTFWDTPTMQVAERAMRHAVSRHRVLAHNLANANTPNYVRLDLPFPVLSNPVGGRAVQLTVQHGLNPTPTDLRTTDPRHYASLPFPSQQGESAIPLPTPMRIDGNTVDPEQEMALLAENELRYAMLARIADGQIRSLMNAISGGRTQ